MSGQALPVRLTLYTRPGCHLCDLMRDAVWRAAARVPLTLDEIDITTDPALTTRYGTEVPVLLAGGRELARHRITDAGLVEGLTRASRNRDADG
ncbi:MAG TPA: glutaredoxin family protein [Vicinamibacterales bacterium]|nr:glutaredoxin family protein [Vicinamibacterales bacterium]